KDQNRLRLAAMRVTILAPDRPEGFTLKALWQRRGGDLNGALASLAKAVEKRGRQSDPLMLQGITLEELGRCDEARSSFAAVLADEPGNAEARRALESIRLAGAPEAR